MLRTCQFPKQASKELTVITPPQANLTNSSPSPNIPTTPLSSPMRTNTGTIATVDKALVYHARRMAELLTCGKDDLMTILCRAVVHDERTPKTMPMLPRQRRRTG